MSARRRLQIIPKEALVYFKFDESTCIVPSKKLHGDVTLNGNVTMTFGGKYLACQVIALSNDNAKLLDLDATFWKKKNRNGNPDDGDAEDDDGVDAAENPDDGDAENPDDDDAENPDDGNAENAVGVDAAENPDDGDAENADGVDAAENPDDGDAENAVGVDAAENPDENDGERAAEEPSPKRPRLECLDDSIQEFVEKTIGNLLEIPANLPCRCDKTQQLLVSQAEVIHQLTSRQEKMEELLQQILQNQRDIIAQQQPTPHQPTQQPNRRLFTTPTVATGPDGVIMLNKQ